MALYFARVSEGIRRPFWSVMIPTYNCVHRYLCTTLLSVLAQDPGPDRMQIAVVDNCSTIHDVEKLVANVGHGRIQFFRNARNEGIIGNFNRCIERSIGETIHILHSDDCVIDGFYKNFEAAFSESPDGSAIFSPTIFIDQEGNKIGRTRYCRSLMNVSNDPREFLKEIPIQCAGVAVRRSFYEEYGGFDTGLVHTADWDMWVRTIVYGGARMINEPLACYRIHDANDTSRLSQTAENLRDHLRLSEKWQGQNLVGFNPAAFERRVARRAFAQAQRFRARGNYEAARANYEFWREHCPLSQYPRVFAKAVPREMKLRLQGILHKSRGETIPK